MELKKHELAGILDRHRAWLKDEPGGKKADLQGADLREANLRGADLRVAKLQEAYLQEADLRGARLQGADMCGANLRGADLRGADIDYSAWPLCCGSFDVKVDKRIACQLLYHAIRVMQGVDDPEVQRVCSNPDVLLLANKFHRVGECGEIRARDVQKMKTGDRSWRHVPSCLLHSMCKLCRQTLKFILKV